MEPSSAQDAAAVFDFINDYLDDFESGKVRPLAEYLSRYAGHEEDVSREFLRMQEECAAEAPVAASQQRSVGPYRLIRELGRGGQGAVFLADDTRIARRVALKLLEGVFVNDERRRRFRREAEIIARLEHPGICAIHEADIGGDVPYIAMRYVEGVALSKALAEPELWPAQDDTGDTSDTSVPSVTWAPWAPTKRADLHRLLLIFERIARALHTAHVAGVIHRDIKPGNIIITPEGEPVLLDFGLARDRGSAADDLTQSGEIFGTPAYMSPEQVRGVELDRRTDVYSLGVTLFEALTRKRPFSGAQRLVLEHSILVDPVPDVRRANRLLGAELQVVIEKALEKDVARRYTSALELAEDLRRLRQFEPIQARPASTSLRLRRWVRRQPVLATALISTLIALSGGLFVSLHLLGREQRAVRDKDSALRVAVGRHLAERAAKLTAVDPALALVLGIEAVERAPTNYLTRSGLFAPLDACNLEAQVMLEGVRRLWDLDVSDDGRLIAGAADDGSVHLWNMAGAEAVDRFDCETNIVRSLDLSHDGRWLAAGTEGGSLQVWSLAERRRVFEQTLAAGPLLWVEFSPDDSQLVALPSEDPAAIYTTSDWTRQVEIATRALSASCARFSPDGTLLLTSSMGQRGLPLVQDPQLQLWDTQSGECLRELGASHGNIQWSEFDPSGERVVSSDDEGTVRLWDVASGDQLGPALMHEGIVTCATFSPDGLELATTTDDAEDSLAFVWDLAARTRIAFEGHQQSLIVHASFSPDGEHVATSSFDNTVRVWDAASGREERVFRAAFRPLRAFFSPEGRRVVTLSNSPRVHIWRVGNQPFVYRLDGHDGPVSAARFSADGSHAMTAAADGSLILWRTPPAQELEGSVDPGTCVRRFETGDGPVDTFYWLEEQSLLVALTRAGRVCVFRTASGERAVPDTQITAGVLDSALRPDGRRLVVVARDGRAWFLTPEHGGPAIRLQGRERITCAAFSSDGQFLALAGDGDLAWIHAGDDGALLRTIEPIEFNTRSTSAPRVIDVAFRPTRHELALACSDRGIRFRDAESGKETRPTLLALLARRIEFGSDGDKLLVTGLRGGAGIGLHDLARDAVILPDVKHASHITSTTLTADGRYVISGSVDESVHVWEAATGRPVAQRSGHGGAVPVVSASRRPGDMRVLSATADGGVLVWPVDPVEAARARRPRELEDYERQRERKLASPLPFD